MAAISSGRHGIFCVVPKTGFEPARPEGQGILGTLGIPFHHFGKLCVRRDFNPHDLAATWT